MRIPRLRAKADNLLPPATAEQILSNVFMICNREPNNVPLEALTAYSNYRKERYALQRSVIGLMMMLFLLLPLLFFAAGITVMLVNPDSDENPVYTVSVDTQIPIRQIEAHLGGQTVPLYEIAPGEYKAIPLENGTMQISVTLINQQATITDVTIENVDHDAPTLISSEFGKDSMALYLTDADSGVNYAGITVRNDAGESIPLLGFDSVAGYITLAYPKEPLYLQIPDVRGNVLEINLKPEE